MAMLLTIGMLVLLGFCISVLLVGVVHRGRWWPASSMEPFDYGPLPPPEDGDESTGVREPRRPRPSSGSAAAEEGAA
jgi:hypothetical protein